MRTMVQANGLVRSPILRDTNEIPLPSHTPLPVPIPVPLYGHTYHGPNNTVV